MNPGPTGKESAVDEQAFSVRSAQEAARRDRLDEWVAEFLSSPGSDNAELAQLLSEKPRHWLGPVVVPFSQLNRLAGPEGEPVLCPVDDDEWGDNVDDMKDEFEDGWEPPPLIVSFRDGDLVLEDGNHRVEGMRRAGEREGWAVINFENREERDRYAVANRSGAGRSSRRPSV
jgi:hypothetical protein